jgi:hypothetical protein
MRKVTRELPIGAQNLEGVVKNGISFAGYF